MAEFMGVQQPKRRNNQSSYREGDLILERIQNAVPPPGATTAGVIPPQRTTMVERNRVIDLEASNQRTVPVQQEFKEERPRLRENRRKRMKPWPIRSLTEQPHTDLRATTGSSAFGEPTTPREALRSDHPPPIAATPDPASPPSPPPPQPKPHTTGTALFSPLIASHRGGSKQWENRRKRMKPWPIRSLTEQPHTDLRATTGSSAFGEPTTPREALRSDHPPPIAATPDPASPPSPPPPQPKPHTTGTALFSPLIASHRGGSKQWVKKKGS
ncbi:vegetative cell wall protein gp1-like [Vicia villosa]|uniref:vegetative cell wall protein gp1-like n=1 Tax=Vicia villosa TaxID=3911 RepID=UPI00273BB999|nr:vegetative cell wall protein gp1-like [Vicia villosa]